MRSPGRRAAPRAICFQEPRLLPRVSALNNVILGGLARFPAWRTACGTPQALRLQALTALEEVGLAHLANSRADRLSGGQRQRVALARTLVAAAGDAGDLMLCDEPTAHLDPVAADEVVRVLARLQKSAGMAILLSTHNIDVALALADRIAFLDDGRIGYCAPARACTSAGLARLFGGPHPGAGRC